MPDHDLAARRPRRVGRDEVGADEHRAVPVPGAEADELRLAGEVAHDRRLGHGRRARQARQVRRDEHLADVGARHRPQVHLAQDPAEVPPAATRPRREIRRTAAVIDADDQPVDARAEVREVDLERQERPRVGRDLAPVQPHRGPVVDRLKAEHPVAVALGDVGGERLRREREVPPVPADRPGHARVGEIARVVGVGDRRRSPSVGRGRRLATTPGRRRRGPGRRDTATRHRAGSGPSCRRCRARPSSAASPRTPGPGRAPRRRPPRRPSAAMAAVSPTTRAHRRSSALIGGSRGGSSSSWPASSSFSAWASASASASARP